MKLLIIEDEIAAAQNLQAILQELSIDVELLAILESVEEAIRWFKHHSPPDLAFVDIQLADGSSFDVFEHVEATFPVVFVTAFDEYAVRAFSVNSIDYLLKPIDRDAVSTALQKYQQRIVSPLSNLSSLRELLLKKPFAFPSYRSSFLIHYRNKLLPIEVESFAYFFSKEKIVRGITHNQDTHILQQTLEELEQELDPTVFYRANRQYVVARRAIVNIEFYFNGRLLLNLTPASPDRVLVSKARSSDFKHWISD